MWWWVLGVVAAAEVEPAVPLPSLRPDFEARLEHRWGELRPARRAQLHGVALYGGTFGAGLLTLGVFASTHTFHTGPSLPGMLLTGGLTAGLLTGSVVASTRSAMRLNLSGQPTSPVAGLCVMGIGAVTFLTALPRDDRQAWLGVGVLALGPSVQLLANAFGLHKARKARKARMITIGGVPSRPTLGLSAAW